MEYALLGTAAAGMLGWFFAWRASSAAADKVQAAVAAETAARSLVVEATGRAVTAETKAADANARANSLQAQLDAERKARQDLVNALAKSGAPVGPVAVDVAMDGLYADGGGAGPNAGASGNPAPVSSQPPSAAAAPRKS